MAALAEKEVPPALLSGDDADEQEDEHDQQNGFNQRDRSRKKGSERRVSN